jgi:hypothetical protein
MLSVVPGEPLILRIAMRADVRWRKAANERHARMPVSGAIEDLLPGRSREGQLSRPRAQPCSQRRAAAAYSSRRTAMRLCAHPACAGAHPAADRRASVQATVLSRSGRNCDPASCASLAAPCCEATVNPPQHGDPGQTTRVLKHPDHYRGQLARDGGGVRTGYAGSCREQLFARNRTGMRQP